jgi:uncharacterized membrane protein
MEHQVSAEVAAPPEAVWNLFVDLERWPEMTKSQREVRRLDSGPLKVGSVALVRQPRLPRARWRVTELEPGHSFIWETSSPGLTGVGGHTVEANGQGSVVTLFIRTQGALAGLVELMLGGLSRRYIEMELDGFKRTAEAQSGGAG